MKIVKHLFIILPGTFIAVSIKVKITPLSMLLPPYKISCVSLTTFKDIIAKTIKIVFRPFSNVHVLIDIVIYSFPMPLPLNKLPHIC